MVRDNVWRRIRSAMGDPVPAILFWSASSGTIVERNLLVDCSGGIAFGNSGQGPGSHSGGIVRNNIFYAELEHDMAIQMVHAAGWLMAHNTVIGLMPMSAWCMEARFADTSGTFAYNLSNLDIFHDRDGAQGIVQGNVTHATTDWFVDADDADLHLLATTTDAIDQAAELADVTDDFDGDPRPMGTAPDVGADEYDGSQPVNATSSWSALKALFREAGERQAPRAGSQ